MKKNNSNKFYFVKTYSDSVNKQIEDYGLYVESLERQALSACVHGEKYLSYILDNSIKFKFYDRLHQKVFHVIKTLHLEQKDINHIEVINKYQSMGMIEHKDDTSRVTNIVLDPDPKLSTIKSCINSLKNSYHKRELLFLCQKTVKGIIEGEDSDTVYARLKVTIDDYVSIDEENKVVELGEIIQEVSNEIDERDANSNVGRLKIPYPNLAKIIPVLDNGDVLTIAARPGMGKSDLAICLVREFSKQDSMVYPDKKNRGGLLSFEMKPKALAERALAQESDLSRTEFKLNTLAEKDRQLKNKTAKEMGDLNVAVFSAYDSDIWNMIITIESEHKKEPFDYLVIDYLQLIGDKGSNGDQERISNISRQVKLLALKLNIPLIQLSQLSRESAKTSGRDGKVRKPGLTDLRGSGSIEQDTDIAMFIHRPKYYDDETKNDLIQDAIIIVGKQRNGSLGEAVLSYKTTSGAFSNADYSISEEEVGAIEKAEDWDEDFSDESPL